MGGCALMPRDPKSTGKKGGNPQNGVRGWLWVSRHRDRKRWEEGEKDAKEAKRTKTNRRSTEDLLTWWA